MHLTHLLRKAARERPHDIAIVDGEGRMTFVQLAERAARFAGALRSLGVQPGDRVGMLAHNSHRYAEFLMGCWWAGAVVNPVNVRWRMAEVAYSLDDCDTRVLVLGEYFTAEADAIDARSLRKRILPNDYEQLLARAEPVSDADRGFEDLAAVMYTGGTTGHPKGVMLSHRNLVANALAAVAVFPDALDRIGLVSAPLFHIGACAQWLQLLVTLRGRTVLLPFFDEVEVLHAIGRERVTDTFLVPTMIKRVIEHPRFAEFDLSSLRTVRCTARRRSMRRCSPPRCARCRA